DENNPVALTGNEPVSMNFWGFTPPIFQFLEDQFVEFLTDNEDSLKAEFPIPSVVDRLIKNKRAKVTVLDCSAIWFGVTYQEDKPYVMEQLRKL
ncbi:MAG TPA: nucleotidyltransferase, partial [Bacteroidales bacterium]|nr:nucleotidyltransferase [Bacteroidales bacterium]